MTLPAHRPVSSGRDNGWSGSSSGRNTGRPRAIASARFHRLRGTALCPPRRIASRRSAWGGRRAWCGWDVRPTPGHRVSGPALGKPIQIRQALPDLLRFGRRIAQLHGRAGQPEFGGLQLEAFGNGLVRIGQTNTARIDGHKPRQGRIAISHGMKFGPAISTRAPPLPG